MTVAQRIKELRTALNLSQKNFATRIEMTQAALSAMEKEIRGIPDKTIKLICFEFGVNENWLKNGVGEKFSETFNLDEYAKSHGASKFELEILKEFFDLPPDVQKALLTLIKTYHKNQNIV